MFPSTALAAADLEILLVGSSLVRGVKPFLKKLYKKELGLKARIKGFGPARWELQRHASSPRTAGIISKNDWDYVFLAQSSTGGLDVAVFPEITKLHDRAASIGSEVGFLMTWFSEATPLYFYDDLRGEVDGTYGYVPIAEILGGVKIAPAGWAIRTAVEDGMALSNGEQVRLWRRGTHLRSQGKYLAAAVVFATIEGRSPLGLWAPGGWEPEEVEYLQTIAHDTLVEGASDWNVNLGP